MGRYTDTIPITGSYTTRLGVTSKDRHYKNVLFDVATDNRGVKTFFISKRPGLSVNSANATGVGRGIYAWKGNIYKIVGSILYKNGASIKNDLTNSTGLVQWTEQHVTDLLVFRDGDKIVTVTAGDVVTEQTDAQIPTGLVPGIVYLNSWIFVMDGDGNIYNCNVDDVTNWTAGDYKTAANEPDDGKVLFKHHEYVVALGDWSAQFFYDASTATGSPLAPVTGSTDLIGCASGNSLVADENTAVWVAKTRAGGPFIAKMQKMSVERLSDSFIDRILEQESTTLDTCRAFGMRINGRLCYVLTLLTSTTTLAVDVETGLWSEWTSDPGTESYFTGIAYTYNDGKHYILDEDNGDDYLLSTGTYQDAGGDINVEVVTGNWRGSEQYQSSHNKFINRLTLLGDEQTSTSTVTIQISKDDYQNWSTARTIDMSKTLPCATQFGAAQQLAVRLQHTANTPLRLSGIEVDYTQGSHTGGNY